MHNNTSPCPYCSSTHSGICHRVKAITYTPDGRIERVELFAPKDYPPIEGLVFGPGNTPALPDIRKINSLADSLLKQDEYIKTESDKQNS